MKRKLTTEEREYTKKGIKLMTKELESYEEELSVYSATLTYLLQKREYENKIRPFNERTQDNEFIGKVKMMNLKIMEATKSVQIAKDTLINGVEKKENKTVG